MSAKGKPNNSNYNDKKIVNQKLDCGSSREELSVEILSKQLQQVISVTFTNRDKHYK